MLIMDYGNVYHSCKQKVLKLFASVSDFFHISVASSSLQKVNLLFRLEKLRRKLTQYRDPIATGTISAKNASASRLMRRWIATRVKERHRPRIRSDKQKLFTFRRNIALIYLSLVIPYEEKFLANLPRNLVEGKFDASRETKAFAENDELIYWLNIYSCQLLTVGRT